MPKIEITKTQGLVQSSGAMLPLTLDETNTVAKVAIIENSTAFVQNARSNVQWTQPANTIITGMSILCTVAPATAASMNLGYVVGTAAAGAQIVAAVADEIIDAGADGTDLAVGGLKTGITIARKTTDAASLAADESFTTTARTVYLGTSASDDTITTAGTVLWLVEYVCFA